MRGASDFRLVGFLVAALLLVGVWYFATRDEDEPERPDPLSSAALLEIVGPPSQRVARRSELIARAFQDGAAAPFGSETVEIEVRSIGGLVLTTGHISVFDPYLLFPEPVALDIAVEPGRYLVDVSIAHRPNGDERIVMARVRILDEPIAMWQMAVFEGDPLAELLRDDRVVGYGVDAGAGAFVDHHAAMVLWRRREVGTEDPTGFLRRLARGTYKDTRDWAVTDVPDANGATIAAFGGLADGFAVSYWGYDAAGRIAALVTDLGLLGDREGSDDEGD